MVISGQRQEGILQIFFLHHFASQRKGCPDAFVRRTHQNDIARAGQATAEVMSSMLEPAVLKARRK